MKYLIIGDPYGHATLSLIENHDVSPSDIYVWEDSAKGQYSVTIEGATVTDNLDDFNGMKFDVVIGNPPYGSGGNLAIKFVNKCAELSDDVRMVLPLSFTKISVQNKVSLNIEIAEERELPLDTFPNGIRAVYQRWVPAKTPREKVILPRTHDDFEFLKYDDRFDANVFIGEYGCGPSGRVKTENFTHYAKGHYFVRAKDQETIDKLVRLESLFREKASGCNGRFHISKGELIEIYVNN